MSENFTPWKVPLQVGLGLAAVAGGGGYLALNASDQLPFWPFLLAGAGAVVALKSAVFRFSGQRVEAQAAAALERILPSSWRMERDIVTPFGNCDIVLMLDHGVTRLIAVEIKSKQQVTVQRGWIRSNRLCYERGSPKKDLRQAARNAKHLAKRGEIECMTVLWFPNAAKNCLDFDVVGSDMGEVLVVAGNAQMLVNAIEKASR